jgi:hypothetical protein
MADVVCAKTERDIAVRNRVVRYGRCRVWKSVSDVAFRYRVVRYDRYGVCKNCKGYSGQIYSSEIWQMWCVQKL